MPSATQYGLLLSGWAKNAVLRRSAVLLASAALLSACAASGTVGFSPGHVLEDTAPIRAPQPVAKKPPPEPVPAVPVPSYTVVVKEVPVIDLLFSLARDAGLDLDLQADSSKVVTLNAVDRPLKEILDRIADQADLRFSLLGSNLIVQDDAPYWHNYLVDYVNIARTSEGEVGVATQIATSGGSVGEQSGQQGDQQGNISKTTVKNTSINDFWTSLEQGLEAIITSNRAQGREATPEEHDPVIINQMSGVATVYGTQTVSYTHLTLPTKVLVC